MPRYTHEDFVRMLEKDREKIIIRAVFVRDHIGGVPATERGLHDFIAHQMKIDPRFDIKPKYDRFGRLLLGKPTSQEFVDAFNRLSEDELEVSRIDEDKIEKAVARPGEELVETKVYGVKCIRCDEFGPFMLDHMIKAAFKCAATRINLYTERSGSKGDVQELGTVMAHGDSLQNPERPWQIYLRKDGKPAVTGYTRLQGRVTTAQGSRSIQYDAETAFEGTEFSFEFRWLRTKMGSGWVRKVARAADILNVFSKAWEIGLGSARSMSYGRWHFIEAITEDASKERDAADQAAEAAEQKKASKKSKKAAQPPAEPAA